MGDTFRVGTRLGDTFRVGTSLGGPSREAARRVFVERTRSRYLSVVESVGGHLVYTDIVICLGPAAVCRYGSPFNIVLYQFSFEMWMFVSSLYCRGVLAGLVTPKDKGNNSCSYSRWIIFDRLPTVRLSRIVLT